MIIEIKGVQFVNKGAELMLHSVLEKIKDNWPDADIALEPNNNSPYKSRALLGSYQKLSIRKNILDFNSISYLLPQIFRKWLINKWGIVTEADIDIVFDASGFAYGDQWGELEIKNLANALHRFKNKKKKYFILPQALGPFSRKKDIQRLGNAFHKASLICTRESVSYEHVYGIDNSLSNLKIYPDFTNLTNGIRPSYYKNGIKKVVIIPNVNMINERNLKKGWSKSYINVLIDSVKVIKGMGFEPVLLNHEGKGDGDICQSVIDSFDFSIELIEESDPLKVKGIIGESKAIICSRFHGCVSALSQNIPCLGTSWSHKYEQLFSEYSSSENILEANFTREDIHEALERAIINVDNESYRAKVKNFKSQSQSMWDEVIKKVNI